MTLYLDGIDMHAVICRLCELGAYPNWVDPATNYSGRQMPKARLRNLAFFVAGDSLTMTGSLPKFYFGTNVETLTRVELALVLEELSDMLGIPLLRAHVWEFEFGGNLRLNDPPVTYFPFLGGLTRCERSENHKHNGHGVYLSNGLRTLLFYDKIREMKTKRQWIPPEYQGCNVMRYEIHYRKDLPRQFGRSVFASTLTDSDFYRRNVGLWAKRYDMIRRRRVPKLSDDILGQTPRTYERSLAAIGLAVTGDLDAHVARLHTASRCGRITDKQRYAINDVLRKLGNGPDLLVDDDRIVELNARVHEFAARQVDMEAPARSGGKHKL